MINVGDLVEFDWPFSANNIITRTGLVLEIFRRPDDVIGDEFYVLCENEKWSVPDSWCKKIE